MDKTETIETMVLLSTRAIKYIRRGEIANAGEALTYFIEYFSTFSEKNQLAKDNNITNMLTVMLKAQERNDMLFVADILQYELLPYVKELVTRQD